jgi:serine/threonine protein kinase
MALPNSIVLWVVLTIAYPSIYLSISPTLRGEMFDFIVAQKRVPEQQACKFLHQIVDGLETLHKHEITHRDLKPENLLLKASADWWIVKIVDFGLSNTHEGGKLLVTACGSPCYAAPEMIAGKKYFGPLADLWSLGVILFALVSGYLPFEDPNTSVLYKKILGCDYTTPRWISAEVRDLINCILEVDPRKRFTIDSIRSHPWYNTVSEELIPRDSAVHKHDTHSDTLAAIEKAGLNPQTVLGTHSINGIYCT